MSQEPPSEGTEQESVGRADETGSQDGGTSDIPASDRADSSSSEASGTSPADQPPTSSGERPEPSTTERSAAGSGTAGGPMPDEVAALRRARVVSQLLDDAVRIPGTNFRVGLDPVLGVLPAAGDSIAAALSLYPVVEAYRLDAPKRTLAKMLALIAIDAAIGSIPVVGTVFDAFWKANKWNVRSLERHLERA